MRDGDRIWWIPGLMSLGLFVVAILAPWWFPRLPVLDDPNPTDPFAMVGGAFIGLMALGVSVYAASATRTMRRRHMKRLAALRGDFTGMPLSVIRPFPELAPDVGAQPLDIMWRVNPVSATLQGLILGLQLLGVLVVPGFILGFVLISHFDPSLKPALFQTPTSAQPMDAGQIATLVTYALIFVGGVVFAVWIVMRPGPTLFFGRPFGMRATADGIENHTNWGGHTFIAWNEIRLFEVSSGSAQISRSFSVYAPGKSITWHEYRVGFAAQYVPVGAMGIETAQRQAALVNLVTARTGLEPRTIVRRLERPPITAPTAAPSSYPPNPLMPYPQPVYPLASYPPAPESYTAGPELYPSVVGRAQAAPAVRLELPAEAQQRARNRRSNVVVWVVFALCLVALACAEGVAPVTDYDWVNWASVAALALLALNCVRLAVVNVRRRKPVVAVAGPPVVAAPALDGASGACALSYRAPARNRGRTFVTGLLLAVNLIPGAIAMFQAFGAIFSINPFFNQQPPTDPANAVIDVFGGLWDFILGFVLVFLGMGGMAQLVVALRLIRAPAVTVRVDANGLTRLTAFKPILIPWSTMREVIWTPHGVGSAPAYIVRTDDPLQTITWPTSPHYLDPTFMPADARPIGADELAALVAARIGQAIRIST